MNSGMETMIAGVTLKNPVTTASGTFGSGREYGELIDLNRLGAITVKGVSEEAWKGNPVPRVAETQDGLLNSIGYRMQEQNILLRMIFRFLDNMIRR